jgi:sulfur carrier protein ThiS
VVTVTVVMHGNLRRFLPDGAMRAAVELPHGATVAMLLERLGAAEDTWLVARNQVTAERDEVLAPGDVVDCFEPVAAG